MQVHSGTQRYMPVWDSFQTSTYSYILVHETHDESTSSVDFFCSRLPRLQHPAGSRESGRIAAAERHTSLNRNHFIDFFRHLSCADPPLAPAWPPAPARPAPRRPRAARSPPRRGRRRRRHHRQRWGRCRDRQICVWESCQSALHLEDALVVDRWICHGRGCAVVMLTSQRR